MKELGQEMFCFRQKFPQNLRYNFIEGPVVDSSRSDFASHPTPKNGSYQLCVRTNDCACLPQVFMLWFISSSDLSDHFYV